MNSFKYEYIEVNDILNDIILIKDFSLIELSVFLVLISLFIINLYFIFPYLYTYYRYLKQIVAKNRKIYLLKQITIEREIEEEMQKEMEQI